MNRRMPMLPDTRCGRVFVQNTTARKGIAPSFSSCIQAQHGGVSGLFDFEYLHAHSGCVNFFALFGQCALPAGRALFRLCLPHPAGGVQTTAYRLCTGGFGSCLVPRCTKIGNSLTRGSALWPRCPSAVIADIGTCSARTVTSRPASRVVAHLAGLLRVMLCAYSPPG